MKKNKKKIILSLGIVSLLVVTLGVSYAIWKTTSLQTNKNVIVSDCFEVTFQEETPAINLQNIYPVMDEEGMKENSYQFSITNKCGSNVRYQVLLESGQESTLNEQYLKVALDQKNAKVLSSLANENKRYVLKEAYLSGNETKTYSLNLWMGDYVTASDTEAMNKTYRGKVKIEAYYTTELKKEITYELEGGNFKEGYSVPSQHTYGSVLSLPTASNVIKEEYVFEGWYDNPEFTGTVYTQIDIYNDQDITLYAKYRRPRIIYDGAGATYNYNEIYYPTWEGSQITLSNDIRFGSYTFEGWYLDNTYTNKVTEVTKDNFQTGKDLNLYAKWNVVTDLWHYEPNTTDPVENMPENQIFIQGQSTTISSKIPTRDGYTFVGWNRRYTTMDIWNELVYSGNKISTNSTTLTERSLYAIWKKNGDFAVDGLQYIIKGDDTVSVAGRIDSSATLNIPATTTYNNINYKVITISNYAFANDQNIENLIINDGIETIEEGSFYHTLKMESITLANTIKTIGKGAFRYVPKLTEVTLPDELTILKQGAFRSCSSLSTINLNNKLTTIEAAVLSTTKIVEMSLPDSLRKLDTQYINFKSLHIGKNLTSLAVSFSENANLTISSENKNFKIQGNYLLNASGKNVYGYIGSWENIVIPNGVEIIKYHSFTRVNSLNPIVLPEGVKKIEYRAFYMANAPEINVPSSIESVDVNAFQLTKIETIKIYKPSGSISGAPWGSTISDIQWLG